MKKEKRKKEREKTEKRKKERKGRTEGERDFFSLLPPILYDAREAGKICKQNASQKGEKVSFPVLASSLPTNKMSRGGANKMGDKKEGKKDETRKKRGNKKYSSLTSALQEFRPTKKSNN